jgi:hypothetical protein
MQKLRQLFTVILGVILLVSSSAAVYAQAPQPAGTPSGSGLSIAPTISEFTIKPGGHQSITITLKNITVDNVVAKGVVNDFVSDNNTGNPKIITDTSIKSPNSLRDFIQNIDDIPLNKGQQKNVILDIQVPKNATPGAYFGVVRYKAVPTGVNAPGPGQVALTASVGTIVLVTVPGNIRQQVQVAGIHVYRGGHDGSIFFGSPNRIGVEVRNYGNGFEKPFGTVELNNTFNKTIVTYQLNNPKQPGNVLPNSTRIFSHDVKGVKRIGRYSVIASVSYGSGSQVLTLKKNFWYIPPWVGILALIILIGLVGLAYRAYRRYNRDKRHSYRR